MSDAGSRHAREWVRALATEIGPRRSGSPEDARAADFVEQAFGRLFPEVRRHEYRFCGWAPVEEGVVDLDGEPISARLGISCPSTPEGGVRGRLRRFGASSVYGLWEPGHHGPSAHLMAYAGQDGRARPVLWSPFASTPAGIVDGALDERLARAADTAAEVGFTCRTAYEPGNRSWNIEGELPGDPARIVVIIGHYDTVYPSPGANDNTASTACLAAIGEALAPSWSAPRPTLRFLATGGEEIDLQGARAYLRDLAWSGEAARVQLVLNFDSLTWGDHMSVFHTDDTANLMPVLERALQSTDRQSYDGSLHSGPVPADGGVDAVPFARAGIPTVNVNTEGDAQTTALWHMPEDTEDRVPWARLDDAAQVFTRFLEEAAV